MSTLLSLHLDVCVFKSVSRQTQVVRTDYTCLSRFLEFSNNALKTAVHSIFLTDCVKFSSFQMLLQLHVCHTCTCTDT